MGIFKAYDIRGLVPGELDAALAKKIGNAFARFLKAKTLVVGQDMRTHSPEHLLAVENELNHRPRHVLGDRSPAALFDLLLRSPDQSVLRR